MASTFAGLGLLSKFSIVFVILLVYVVVFGLLEYVSPFGKEKKGLHGLIALAIAFLTAVSGSASYVIQHLSTWFFVFGFFIVLILLMLGIFGLKEKDFSLAVKSPKVYTWIIIVALIIAFFALGKAFGQSLLESGKGETTIPSEPNGEIEPGVDATTGEFLPRTAPQGSTSSSDFGSNVLQTFISPPVLGLILIMMIGAFSITFMTRSQ